jgi:hypothetical protein
MSFRSALLLVLAAALLRLPCAAQDLPIQDNSFLLEEAYNQEFKVIQTIQTLMLGGQDGGYAYSLTQEWPVPDQRTQLSFTLGLGRAGGAGGARGLGDLALNYRAELLGREGGALAFAPRVSLLVPTGKAELGLGTGSWGAQLNLPVSRQWSERLVTHTNAGATLLPSVLADDGGRARELAFNLGQSVVWLAHPKLNLLLEAVYTRSMRQGAGHEDQLLISPGIRAAIDLGKLQIVPGIGVPIGVGPSSGRASVLVYLSLEHPIGRTE